jgi:hypothetical protein
MGCTKAGAEKSVFKMLAGFSRFGICAFPDDASKVLVDQPSHGHGNATPIPWLSMTSTPAPSSFLDKAGTVALTAVKHMPTRMVLWGLVGLGVGTAGVVVSYILGALKMGRGALLLGYNSIIPVAIVILGAVVFGIHGLHRGTARAALALEEKFGLVDHVVGRVMSMLVGRFGEKLANLPLQQLENALKEIVAKILSSKEEGSWLVSYVVRRAQKAVVLRIEKYLLHAYREELGRDGSGGGIAIRKLHDRVSQEISGRLGELVMAPLNKQLFVFMAAYVLLACGWWYWMGLLFMLLEHVLRLFK